VALLAAPFAPFDFFVLFSWSARSCDQTSICRLKERSFPSRKIEFGPTRRPRNSIEGTQLCLRSPRNSEARRENHGAKGEYILSTQAPFGSSSMAKGVPRRSTASMYSTNFLATANVARLRLPRVNSFSRMAAKCGFQ